MSGNWDDAAVRATFVMSKTSRALLKKAATRYRTSQSEIMNHAPYLFLALAEQSLKHRSSELVEHGRAISEAASVLSNLPHHYLAWSAVEDAKSTIELEEKSIEQKLIRGPSADLIEEVFQREFRTDADPFVNYVLRLLTEVGAEATAAAYRQRFQRNHQVYGYGAEADDFEDDDEIAERDAWMRELLDKVEVNLELDGEVGSNDEDGIDEQEGAPRRWSLAVERQVFGASSGGDLLADLCGWVRMAHPEKFESDVLTIRGRIRPLIAKNPADLYPGNPALVSKGFYRKIPDSDLYVGSNYSELDIRRLVKSIMRAIGLVENLDWHLTYRGH